MQLSVDWASTDSFSVLRVLISVETFSNDVASSSWALDDASSLYSTSFIGTSSIIQSLSIC